MISFVVYGDFNCPFSALADLRAGELERRGLAVFDWRAVEHETTIPRAGTTVAGELADMLTSELAQISGLLRPGEPGRLRLPGRQVNTELAIQRYAGTPPASRPAVRQAIFAAHWERGEPIDDEAVLDRLGAGQPNIATADEWRGHCCVHDNRAATRPTSRRIWCQITRASSSNAAGTVSLGSAWMPSS